MQTFHKNDRVALAEYERQYRGATNLLVWGIVLLGSMITVLFGIGMIIYARARKKAIESEIAEKGYDSMAWAASFNKEAWRLGFWIFGAWLALSLLGLVALVASHSTHR